MGQIEGKWESTRVNRAVHRVDMKSTGEGWEQWFLLSSDRHHDNKKTDHDLELRHLHQARSRSAGVIDVGDLFCAMNGKFDRRSDVANCRPEQQQGRYLDSLVDCASEFYAPFAENFVVIGRGNHETAIYKHHETDLTERLCQAMTAQSGHQVDAGGYGGWVQFVIHRTSTSRQRVNLKFWHGAGGGGPVTRGVITTNRMAVYLPDAHIVCSGHTHDQWVVPIARERLLQNGEVGRDEVLHVKLGTYKEAVGDGWGGWEVETGKPPKPMGAQWLRFFWRDSKTFGYDIHRTD